MVMAKAMVEAAMVEAVMVETATMAAARAAAGLRAPAAGWHTGAPAVGGRLRRAADEPTYRTAAGGAFGWRIRRRRRGSLPPQAPAVDGRREAGACAWRGGQAAAVVAASGLAA